MGQQAGSFDWRGELWRSVTRPRLRWAWLAIAIASIVPTTGCVWILVVNLPAALEGTVAGAQTLQWAMVLFTLLGLTVSIGAWSVYRQARANARRRRGR